MDPFDKIIATTTMRIVIITITILQTQNQELGSQPCRWDCFPGDILGSGIAPGSLLNDTQGCTAVRQHLLWARSLAHRKLKDKRERAKYNPFFPKFSYVVFSWDRKANSLQHVDASWAFSPPSVSSPCSGPGILLWVSCPYSHQKQPWVWGWGRGTEGTDREILPQYFLPQLAF